MINCIYLNKINILFCSVERRNVRRRIHEWYNAMSQLSLDCRAIMGLFRHTRNNNTLLCKCSKFYHYDCITLYLLQFEIPKDTFWILIMRCLKTKWDIDRCVNRLKQTRLVYFCVCLNLHFTDIYSVNLPCSWVVVPCGLS